MRNSELEKNIFVILTLLYIISIVKLMIDEEI